MHSRMRTTRILPYSGVSVRGVSVSMGVSVQRGSLSMNPPRNMAPETETPRRNMGPETETPRLNMGPVSQIGSYIIQGPLPPVDRMTDANKNITLPQASFMGGKYSYHKDPVVSRICLQYQKYRYLEPEICSSNCPHHFD